MSVPLPMLPCWQIRKSGSRSRSQKFGFEILKAHTFMPRCPSTRTEPRFQITCSSICIQAFVTNAYVYIFMNTTDIQTTDIHFQSMDQLEERLLKRHDENHLFISRAENAAAMLQVFTYTHSLTLGPTLHHTRMHMPPIRPCTVWQEEEECAVREHQERAEARVSRQEEQRQEGMSKRFIELQTDEKCFQEGVEVCIRGWGGRHERDKAGRAP